MKMLLLIEFLCVILICTQVMAGNYILTIDGKEHDIELGKETSIELPDGKKIELKLEKKSIASFKVKNFSFEHPSDIMPSRSDLGDGIYQTMVTTPLGTLALIQEYETINPASLVDIMIQELTKEEKNYGYEIMTSPVEVKLGSGKILSGKMSISKYRGEETTRYVLFYSLRYSGLLVVVQFDKDITKEDKAMIDRFWKTLVITMK